MLDPRNYNTDASKAISTKIRLVSTFLNPGSSKMDMLSEVKNLTEKDLADFKIWYEAEGYPCN